MPAVQGSAYANMFPLLWAGRVHIHAEHDLTDGLGALENHDMQVDWAPGLGVELEKKCNKRLFLAPDEGRVFPN